MNNRKRQPSREGSLTLQDRVKPCGEGSGADLLISKQHIGKPLFDNQLMEKICERSNLQEALKRVCRNKGAPGVDGMTVDALKQHLKAHWPAIKRLLLSGEYQVKALRRVAIPKPHGKGKRKLSIPTCLDRFIQQAILQVLQTPWDKTFSTNCYGFRPGRSAHQAIGRVQSYLQAGYSYVVDIDLENFFDRVHHDRLMSRLSQSIKDKRVLKLIRFYLEIGILENGLVQPMTSGVAQGSPLSPFLSNIVLDELDEELTRRGHCFARYGDDCNIYVKSRRAGERVMRSVTRFIEHRLKLRVNQSKSAVDTPQNRCFLGFTFTGGQVMGGRRKISPSSIDRFKRRIRQITCRKRGISMEKRVEELARYTRGWRSYYGFCEARSVLKDLDSWIRRRLRSVYWKQWKTFKNRRRELMKRGVGEELASMSAWSPKGPWKMSHTPGIRIALNNEHFDQLGVPRLFIST